MSEEFKAVETYVGQVCNALVYATGSMTKWKPENTALLSELRDFIRKRFSEGVGHSFKPQAIVAAMILAETMEKLDHAMAVPLTDPANSGFMEQIREILKDSYIQDEPVVQIKPTSPQVAKVAEPASEPVLVEAHRLINQNRQAAYGHPLDNWGRTARIWSEILGTQVTPEQAILCMVGTKLARLVQSPGHRDSIVDVAGYAGLIEMVQDERKRRETAA